ncbi:uncharacterized protein LOC111075949 [Drosophila obscura]|uniref:uncharacterized protein LOC111075949 n=1 Tax=Drosophila obscura TaxID=7282 RepID=UPI001BB1991D|nr:uncharacterized protein LOC111075949 [Drosophila obscura]
MMAEYNSKTNPHTTPAGRKQRKPSYRVSCINGQSSSSSIAPEVYEAKASSKSPETGIEWILLCSFFMALAVICLLPICYFQIKRHLHGDRLSAHPERPHRHRQRQRQRQRRLHRRARSVKPQQDESANEQPSKIEGTRGDTSGRGDSQRRRGGAATQRSPRRGGRVAAQRIAYRRPPTSSSDEFDG